MKTYLTCLAFISFTLIISAPQAKANMIGTDGQNFNPTSNGVDFVTVQSAHTLDSGVLNFGFFFKLRREFTFISR